MGVKTLDKDFLYYASLGHKVMSVEPKSYSNISGFRQKISLINVEKVKESFLLSKHFVKSLFDVNVHSSTLFINLDETSSVMTKFCALKSLEPYFIENWSSGTLTNTISKHRIDAIIVLSTKDNNFVIQEASKLNIPVIGLVDSDTTVNLVSYPVWSNDNSVELQYKITSEISNTILEAKLTQFGISCCG
jgi:ribosomal protein S2